MYGAILGDIIGSPYEFDQGNKTKDFPLFSEDSSYTDDTVMTVAVAEAFLDAGSNDSEEQIKNDLSNICSITRSDIPMPDTDADLTFGSTVRIRNPITVAETAQLCVFLLQHGYLIIWMPFAKRLVYPQR